MDFSEELKTKIRILFENNKKVREELLAGNPDTIREIGSISQKRIEPAEVVKAYESGNKNEIEELYKKSKMMIEVQKLYRELCLAYGKESNVNTDIDR
jgi:hypothetical protein